MESGAVNNFHVIMKLIIKFDGERTDEFLGWDSKLCASLSVYNKTISTSYKGESDRQKSTSTRRPLAQPEMPQIRTFTACSSLPQLVHRSLWFGGYRAKHRLRQQDTDNRRGQPLARNSTDVRERPFGRSTSG